MKRRELTDIEKQEAERLQAVWAKYKSENVGATQTWLAAEAGLGTQAAVGQYLRGIIPLNLTSLLALCRVLGVDLAEISPRLAQNLHYNGMRTTGGDQLQQAPAEWGRVRGSKDGDPFVPIQKVRLNLSAGITGFQVEPEHDDGDTLIVPSAWLKRKGYDPGKLIALTVKGESMESTFHEGDIVVINTADPKPVDGGVYAVNYEGEAVVKRLSRDAGDWWLTSDNPDQRKYHRKVCRGNACIIIGRVVRSESEQF